ncbi:YVTN family beta-propeller protein [Paenibacillus sp. V4I3]|uniref:YncE family protein n=1 Tax=Paenibacillus sp. V4I3 TaxID=3042305 RepID=UPI0027829162|nr:YncE family protein [Paenibacillus sp. V4I3]MDQ0877533.1 YVTN family beta-propeller protein [Paenibacillus sp. V4I3]
MQRKSWHVLKPRVNTLIPRIIATIPVKSPVSNIVVNPVTNRVYFLQGENDLSVLDGNTNKIIATLKTEQLPFQMAVNTRTNRIYLVNFLDGTVSVINGRTNRIITTVKVGERCDEIALNSRTNLIYIATISLSSNKANVAVLNGSTNKIQQRIPFIGRPSEISIDERTNRIYVTNTSKDTVSVIDGSTNNILTSVKVGRNPVITPALNTRTNRLYIANNLSRFCSVLDLRTNQIHNIQLGRLQSEITLNPVTNLIYVSSAQISVKGRLFVIDGRLDRVIRTLTIPSSTNTLINPRTNHLFISEFRETGAAPLKVYNGSTLKRIAILRPTKRSGATVLNPRTNRIYSGGETNITVIQD